MNRLMLMLILILIAFVPSGCASTQDQPAANQPATSPSATSPSATNQPASSTRADAPPRRESPVQLGNFSVSLAVKELAASRAFYEKLGFRPIGGDAKGWLILQNDSCTIGLFQGMFDKNILTFNPGWNREAQALESFQDIRDIQRTLRERGITPVMPADESSEAPASLMLVDPDGNQILLDQHVPKPKK